MSRGNRDNEIMLLKAIVAISALLVLYAVATRSDAAEISKHAHQYAGIRKAAELCAAKNGALTWTQVEQYVLHSAPQGYTLEGDNLSFVCKVPSKPAPVTWRVTWSAPATRVDGTVLLPSEIRGYQVLINGEVVAMTAGTEYTTAPLLSLDGVALRTVDISGRLSASVPLQ